MTTLKPALAAILAATFVASVPAFAEEPAPSTSGSKHHCQMGARLKAVRAAWTTPDETGTTRLQRVVTTAAGAAAATAVTVGVVTVATAVTVVPACLSGQCAQALQQAPVINPTQVQPVGIQPRVAVAP